MTPLFLTAFLAVVIYCEGAVRPVTHTRSRRSVEAFSWKNCGPENATVYLEKLELAPFPMLLPGKLHINMSSKVNAEIENLDMSVEIYQLNTWFGDWQLPCIFNVGSCVYRDVCALAQGEDDFIAEAEALTAAGGGNITCPIQPLHFQVENYEFQLPSLPAGLGLAIAGDYRIRATLLVPDSDIVLGCFEMEMGIQEAEPEVEEPEMEYYDDETQEGVVVEDDTATDCWIWC